MFDLLNKSYNFMSHLRQKVFWYSWLGVLSALPLQAQTDSVAMAQPERIAVLDFSIGRVNRKQREGLTRALANVCRAETRFVVTSEIALAAYLKKRRHFSIFVADGVQALCKNFSLDYLIVSTIEPVTVSEPSSTPQAWQLTLRWLDGGTGQITKVHAQECRGDLNTPESFPLRELLSGLLESPDIIVAVENVPAAMPSLAESNVSMVDSLTIEPANKILPQYRQQNHRGRSWWWYVTGAALVSGGSAAFLLRHSSKSEAGGRALLPEPPDPPK
jgi:hypothetical protein